MYVNPERKLTLSLFMTVRKKERTLLKPVCLLGRGLDKGRGKASRFVSHSEVTSKMPSSWLVKLEQRQKVESSSVDGREKAIRFLPYLVHRGLRASGAGSTQAGVMKGEPS